MSLHMINIVGIAYVYNNVFLIDLFSLRFQSNGGSIFNIKKRGLLMGLLLMFVFLVSYDLSRIC